MATYSFRLLALFSFILIVSCLATQTVWRIELQGKSSAKSRFYVLNNWNEKGGVYDPSDSKPFPALQTSDIMLKTMGILRASATWSGVRLGHLFQRPKATALFLINGLSDSVPFNSLSDQSYSVDQTGLTGLNDYDNAQLFQDNSILQHFKSLFNEQSLSLHVSQDVQNEVNTNSFSSAKDFDFSSPVDQQFVQNVLAVKNSVRKLSSAAVTDSAPDVFVFSFSSLRALEAKYTSDSKQMKTALKIVTETIKEVTKQLKELYNDNIVVQALVLQWSYPKLSNEQITGIKTVLETSELSKSEVDTMIKQLPSITVPDKLASTSEERSSLCSGLSFFMELENGKLNAEPDCYSTTSSNSHRLRREVYDSPVGDLPSGNNTYRFGTVNGLVEERSENFPAIFLIVFVTVVPMALSLFAISWAMWNMDPGSDSVIYRNTDPVGIKLE